MVDLSVTVKCLEGRAIAYPDWRPIGSDGTLLNAGESIIMNLSTEQVAADKGSLELIRNLWQSVGVGSADEVFKREEGQVSLTNNTPFTLEVVHYLDYEQWDYEPVESENITLLSGESITVDIVHANSQTLWVRKLTRPENV